MKCSIQIVKLMNFVYKYETYLETFDQIFKLNTEICAINIIFSSFSFFSPLNVYIAANEKFCLPQQSKQSSEIGSWPTFVKVGFGEVIKDIFFTLELFSFKNECACAQISDA